MSGDRTRSKGAGKPGAPAGVQPGPRRPAGCGGEAEAGTCNISFVIKTGSGRRRARRIGTARRMKTRRSPRERDTARGPGCLARPGLTVPECRPHGTRQREGGTGAGPAPGASEATSARVPRKGTHPALPPQPSSEGAHRSHPRRQLGHPGVTAARWLMGLRLCPSPPPAWIWGWAVHRRRPPCPPLGPPQGARPPLGMAPACHRCCNSPPGDWERAAAPGGSHAPTDTRTHTGTPACGHTRPPPTHARVRQRAACRPRERRGERGARRRPPSPHSKVGVPGATRGGLGYALVLLKSLLGGVLCW